ncbi:efflux RND transporter permease subunit [Echinimonas agarilytica]|uniref:Efflux RND transporter permease subunit n=1 Tax=Echinimonas agarilytica TaxID=1215918 RepID=A0AA41W5Y3_9GAMM|nr:efflux RND transporter permease subunit [Echinimonas agarilytica]MCM2679310.1 efflux RND transporter permease subunit [Echinimonas agarilytica]
MDESSQTRSKGLIAWFAYNPVAANLLMLLIIIAGLMSLSSIRKQVFPNIEFNIISVRVLYPGAAPLEVEEGINAKIEESLSDINGIKKVTSIAYEGLGTVDVEVQDDFSVQEVLDEVKVNVDAIISFPENAEKPIISRVKPTSQVLWLSINGAIDEASMKAITHEVRDEVANLPTVSSAKIFGARDDEVAIEVSESQLQKYGVTFNEVVSAVRRSSIDLPGGSIKSDAGSLLLRTKGQAYTGADFEKIILRTRPDGTRLYVGDVASINDGFVEELNYSHFDRNPSIAIQISAVGNQSVLEIAADVKAYAKEKQASLPEGVILSEWADNSFYLQDRLDLMTRNMIYGGLLVFLVLSLFLRLSLAFWVMLGLPICFLGTFIVMPTPPIDVSINMISLFGFILVLGIVVDDAIIIGESSWAEAEKKGHTLENIIRGAKKVAMPATFGVLTTIAAFWPMLMVPGPFGVIWKTIGIVVIVCLVFSLIESKLILPAHLRHMKVKKIDSSSRNPFYRLQAFFAKGMSLFIANQYQPALLVCLKYRYVTLSSFIGMLILSVALLGSGKVRWEFFPNIPSDFIMVSVDMIEGSADTATIRALETIENSLYEMDQELFEEHGYRVVKHSNTWMEGSLSGRMVVELLKNENRDVDGFEIVNFWREATPEIAGVRVLDFQGSTNPGVGADLGFQLTGKNMQSLQAASAELKAKLVSYGGVYNVKDSYSGGAQEITLSIKPEAEALGLSLFDLAQQVRFGFYGAEAQRIQRGDEEVKVMVRYTKRERSSIGYLENMRVRTESGKEVPFSSVATFEISDGYSSITRINGSRAIDVTAAVDKAVAESDKIRADIEDNFIQELLARYPDVSYALEGASLEEQKALVSLAKAFGVALIVIFGLIAIPLKSYSQPLIVMSVIPFGMIGAIVGHWILGLSVSVLSLCGIVALAGVVVNDSLILVDFVNRARNEGVRIYDAAVSAGGQRFRAIVLTSLTTFFGLAPIVLEKSLQAQIVIPMAVSLAFGILFATVITLFMVPCLYLILDDFKTQFRRMFQYVSSLYSNA